MSVNQTSAGPVTAAHAQWIITLLGAILFIQIIALVMVIALG